MFKRIGIAAGVIGIAALALVAAAPLYTASASPPAPANAAPPVDATPTATSAAAPDDATTATADFAGWPLRIQGRPLRLDNPGANGWFFWHDRDGLHIRTTTPAPRDHVFTAVLATDGTFGDVDKVRLEGADDIARLDNGHVLVVRFHTYAGTDGVDFRIAGGSGLRLRLAEAGQRVPTSRIFMGRYGVHPGDNPFAVRRG